MNAQLAATVAGRISMNGCSPIPGASAARTGRSVAVVAALEVRSVKKITVAVTTSTMTHVGMPVK